MGGRRLPALELDDAERAEMKALCRAAKRGRPWRCGRGSSWLARKAGRTGRSRPGLRSTKIRSASGVDGSSTIGSTGFAMRLVPERRARSRMGASKHDRQDTGKRAQECYPLEFAWHGQGEWAVDCERAANSACLRSAAASAGRCRRRALTLLHPSVPSCYASTRSRKSRRSTAVSPCAGQPARMSHDYRRHCVTSLFAALDIATSRLIGKRYARHRAAEERHGSPGPRV